jgi:hypothetical protein
MYLYFSKSNVVVYFQGNKLKACSINEMDDENNFNKWNIIPDSFGFGYNVFWENKIQFKYNSEKKKVLLYPGYPDECNDSCLVYDPKNDFEPFFSIFNSSEEDSEVEFVELLDYMYVLK